MFKGLICSLVLCSAVSAANMPTPVGDVYALGLFNYYPDVLSLGDAAVTVNYAWKEFGVEGDLRPWENALGGTVREAFFATGETTAAIQIQIDPFTPVPFPSSLVFIGVDPVAAYYGIGEAGVQPGNPIEFSGGDPGYFELLSYTVQTLDPDGKQLSAVHTWLGPGGGPWSGTLPHDDLLAPLNHGAWGIDEPVDVINFQIDLGFVVPEPAAGLLLGVPLLLRRLRR